MKTENKNSTLFIVILSIIVLLCGLAVYAQQDSDSSTTKETDTTKPSDLLTSTYEENLKRWQSLTKEERAIIRERAQTLDPAQLKALREKSTKFNSMPKEVQDRIKSNFRIFNKLPLEERNVLEERYRRFIKLPPEKREELRHKFRDKIEVPLDVLNGPTTGIVPGGNTGGESTDDSTTGPKGDINGGSSGDPGRGSDGESGGGGNGGAGGGGGRSR